MVSRAGSLLASATPHHRWPDPPDVLLETVNGRRVGIEVTELLDPDAVKRHSDRKKRGDPPAFDTAQWTPTRMAETLSQIIGVKDHKLRKVASGFDECFLAIVTDEPGIDECSRAMPFRGAGQLFSTSIAHF